MYGGGFSGGTPDPIGEATAKLFYAFWANAWSSGAPSYTYTLGGTRGTDAQALQRAIWYLEGELTNNLNGGANNDTLVTYSQLTGKVKDFVDYAQGGGSYSAGVTWAALGRGTWSGVGGVRALNLWSTGHAGEVDLRQAVADVRGSAARRCPDGIRAARRVGHRQARAGARALRLGGSTARAVGNLRRPGGLMAPGPAFCLQRPAFE